MCQFKRKCWDSKRHKSIVDFSSKIDPYKSFVKVYLGVDTQ